MYRKKYGRPLFKATAALMALKFKVQKRAQERQQADNESVDSDECVSETNNEEVVSDQEEQENEESPYNSGGESLVDDDVSSTEVWSNDSEQEDLDYEEQWIQDFINTIDEDLEKDDIKKFVQEAMKQLRSDDTKDDMVKVGRILEAIDALKVPGLYEPAGKVLTYSGIANFLVDMIASTEPMDSNAEQALDHAWGILIGFTDVCKKFSAAVAEESVIKTMTGLILNEEATDDDGYAHNALTMLYLMARDGREMQAFKKENTFEAVLPYLDSNDKARRAYAFLTLVHISDEASLKKHVAESDMISKCISWLRKDLSDRKKGGDSAHHGLHLWELTLGLAKLAAIDANKEESWALKVLNDGILGVLTQLLLSDDPKEQYASVVCLWNMAFDDHVRKAIEIYPKLMGPLKRLRESSDKKVKDSVNGALWVITQSSGVVERGPQGAGRSNKHSKDIFISYCWNEQKTTKQIHRFLKEKGYKVWFDLEEMTGSTLDAMAKAVESAAVVLICASQGYQNSTNCRTEAEYSYKKKKTVIPLMMQRDYEPDGWLGALMGTKLYFKFTENSKENQTQLENLYKEIQKSHKKPGSAEN